MTTTRTAASLLGLLLCAALPARAQATTDEAAAKIVTSLVTASLSNDPQLDVMSSEDVRRVVALEADKQSLGCSEASCLAEVAGAMGANVVVFGDLGHLGRVYIVTLSTFDSKEGRASGRAVVKAANVEELAEKIEPAVAQLMTTFPRVAEGRTRVIVLDIATSGAAAAGAAVAEAPPPVDEPPGAPWLLIGGGATAGVGALLVGAGLVPGIIALVAHNAADPSQGATQVVANQLYDDRDDAQLAANLLFLGGGLLVVGGGAVAGLHFLVGE